MIARAVALLALSLSAAPALAQVLLPPADVPGARRSQPVPRIYEEPEIERPPAPRPQPQPQYQYQPPARGSYDSPVERQELPPPPAASDVPSIMAPPQPAQNLPAQNLPPQTPPSQTVRPGALPQPSAPGIQTQTPPSPAGAVPPGSEDFVVVAPPAQRIENRTATFNGLDKITGRIIVFDAAIGETVQFGALQVTPRACYTRPPSETPNTTGFLEVDEITLQGDMRRIFTGWMFAASPGLHAVEHAIYDVWLVDCKQAPPNLEAQTRR
ncbi:DUF2155 domain-containing protein [Blastochloris tepida]|uniref:DUF2155 domain-containing protein n=1 Tax=Blastochloris tepida TaxID=2233851 RepID=A0A348G2F6_9HYPH|nr:DUF2155 domain-containing protein [Blastochloris tepida]BBF93739.1 hypothetical protein BLTE_24240 [Blastochloris tepida]